MGGVRAPQAAFRLVSDHRIPVIEKPQIIEKIVEVEKLVPDPALQNEVYRLRELLKAEGEKSTLLSQVIAQSPEIPRTVERVVERIVFQDVIVHKERLVEVRIPIVFHKNRVFQISAIISLLLGLGLGALL